MVADDIVFRFDVRPAQEDHAKYQRRPERGQTLDTLVAVEDPGDESA